MLTTRNLIDNNNVVKFSEKLKNMQTKLIEMTDTLDLKIKEVDLKLKDLYEYEKELIIKIKFVDDKLEELDKIIYDF